MISDNSRTLLFWLVTILLVSGYAASQWFWHLGRASNWTHIIDVPSVKWLSMGLFILIVAVGFAKGGDQ